jgi:hypothetical protein
VSAWDGVLLAAHAVGAADLELSAARVAADLSGSIDGVDLRIEVRARSLCVARRDVPAAFGSGLDDASFWIAREAEYASRRGGSNVGVVSRSRRRQSRLEPGACDRLRSDHRETSVISTIHVTSQMTTSATILRARVLARPPVKAVLAARGPPGGC